MRARAMRKPAGAGAMAMVGVSRGRQWRPRGAAAAAAAAAARAKMAGRHTRASVIISDGSRGACAPGSAAPSPWPLAAADARRRRWKGAGVSPKSYTAESETVTENAAEGDLGDSMHDAAESTDSDVLQSYVASHGGKRAIRKILVANNGMAATKCIMSMRKWAFLALGDETALQFVAMATPEDLNANSEYIRHADEYVQVPGGSNANNYANVQLIVDIAVREGVDAVWPGWGHASENPKLPDALKSRGITFIGPTAPVMSVLGDKIAANILAQTAKVPSIPWSGDGLTAELTSDGRVPEDTFNKAMVHSEVLLLLLRHSRSNS